MTRPVIGVATPQRITPAWPFLWLAVRLAGGRPLRLPPGREPRGLAGLDGLILGGGADIGAELYGSRAVLDTKLDPARDAAELALIEEAWPLGLPILGICRGAQMMAVCRGGTLHEEVWDVYEDAPRMWTPLPLKRVTIGDGTALGTITGVARLRVNSLHHQSIDALGQGLKVSARDGVGMVQAIEAEGADFRIGVQWHPEFLLYKRPHRRLFRALVAAAREHRAARGGGVVREPAAA